MSEEVRPKVQRQQQAIFYYDARGRRKIRIGTMGVSRNMVVSALREQFGPSARVWKEEGALLAGYIGETGRIILGLGDTYEELAKSLFRFFNDMAGGSDVTGLPSDTGDDSTPGGDGGSNTGNVDATVADKVGNVDGPGGHEEEVGTGAEQTRVVAGLVERVIL